MGLLPPALRRAETKGGVVGIGRDGSEQYKHKGGGKNRGKEEERRDRQKTDIETNRETDRETNRQRDKQTLFDILNPTIP